MNSKLEIEIWRGREDGHFVAYEAEAEASQTVLDVVLNIQRYQDPTLSYRYACRVGMCGSCAMTVNETPRWTCRSHIAKVAPSGRLRIAPLSNFPIIKDLAVDMTTFFKKWMKADGYFHPTRSTNEPFAKVSPLSAARRAADAGTECINCGICYAVCDVVQWNKNYLGPAALNRAWTLANDVRDGNQLERLIAVSGDDGCNSCHSQQSCTEHCPMGISPTFSIAGLKRMTAAAALKQKL